jgi:hypothetical protein
MNDGREVISAFLDDEPFDPSELANALSEPSGRALLIDLIALRHILQPEDTVPAGKAVIPRRRSPTGTFLAAAAVFVALLGGYAVGTIRRAADLSQPPAPTSVVQASSAWQDLLPGGSSQ